MSEVFACVLTLVALCLVGCTARKGGGATSAGATGRGVSVKSADIAGTNDNWENTTQIRSIAFSGSSTAWLVTGKDGELLHTSNGGATWDRVPAARVGGFDVINFINEQRGWAVSKQAQVWRTTDGGRTWTETASLRPPDGATEFTSANSILFADEQRGWIVETFSVWHTEDGGRDWARGLSTSLPASAGNDILDIFFLNPQVGWACGSRGRLYHTIDGGFTWHSQVVANGDDYFYQIQFIDTRTGWLKGGNSIYRTVDGGETWQPRQIAVEGIVAGLTSFVSADEGWIVGHLEQGGGTVAYSERGIVLHTTDGGSRWQTLEVGENEPFFSRVHFIDEREGWLFSRDNAYRTEDGGETWHLILRLPPVNQRATFRAG